MWLEMLWERNQLKINLFSASLNLRLNLDKKKKKTRVKWLKISGAPETPQINGKMNKKTEANSSLLISHTQLLWDKVTDYHSIQRPNKFKPYKAKGYVNKKKYNNFSFKKQVQNQAIL